MKTRINLATSIVVALGISILLTSCDSSSLSFDDNETAGNINQPVVEAPAYSSNARVGEEIPGEYVVILKKNINNVENRIRQIEKATKGTAGEYYKHTRSFTLTVPANASNKVIQALNKNPHIEIAEVNKVVERTNVQNDVRWNLDRIDQRDATLDNKYYYTNAAEDVTVYVIDSGINYTHDDFEGRATFGFDIFGEDGADCDGHGTHVAGTIGGKTWGVAKKSNLVSVKVLDCDGNSTTSRVIAGVNWVTENASGPSVANLSLIGGGSYALDAAIRNSIESGITYVIAAGNSNADACSYSPARVGEGITVGATTSADARASYSNYGDCIDIFAPGSSVRSAWIGSNTTERTISGSSMAAPHVAGAAALYLQDNPQATPAQVNAHITDLSTRGIVSNSSSTNNHLLYLDAESVKSSGSTRIVRRGSRW